MNTTKKRKIARNSPVLPNAEVWDNQVVDYCRVIELQKGWKFIWQGVWFVVKKRTSTHIKYNPISNDRYINGLHKIGGRSQMFVQVVKTS